LAIIGLRMTVEAVGVQKGIDNIQGVLK
jgi:hypothetical protein